MNDRPDPLTPADSDLRCLPFMPLEVERLRKSRAWLVCKRRPELAFYMLNLWMRAWHETPAGSIEDDDDVLADAAGIDPSRWDGIKADVMRGWVLCNDDRWYHPVVAEKVIDAWGKRVEYNEERRKDRERKKVKRTADPPPPSHEATSVHRNSDSRPSEFRWKNLFKGEGEGEGDREGQGQSETPSLSVGAALVETSAPTKRGSRLPADWPLTAALHAMAVETRNDAKLPPVDVATEHAKFCDYWHAQSGKAATKVDWQATWRNWIRNARTGLAQPNGQHVQTINGQPVTMRPGWRYTRDKGLLNEKGYPIKPSGEIDLNRIAG